MTDILLEQVGDFTEFLMTAGGMSGTLESNVNSLLVKHQLGTLNPKSLKKLEELSFRQIAKSEWTKTELNTHGPYLRTGRFEVKTRYSFASHPNYKGKLAWDMKAQLIYNGLTMGSKVFADSSEFLEFPTLFENSFPKLDCTSLTAPIQSIDDLRVLATAYCEMHIRQGRTSSDPNVVLRALAEKQNKYQETDDFADHHPLTICSRWALYISTQKDAMYAKNFLTFINEGMYTSYNSGVPISEIIAYDPDVVKMFK